MRGPGPPPSARASRPPPPHVRRRPPSPPRASPAPGCPHRASCGSRPPYGPCAPHAASPSRRRTARRTDADRAGCGGVPSAPLRIAARRSSRTPASAPARIRAASAPVRSGGPDETATAPAPCPRGAPPPRSPSRAPACRTTRSRRPRSPPDSSRTAHGSGTARRSRACRAAVRSGARETPRRTSRRACADAAP